MVPWASPPSTSADLSLLLRNARHLALIYAAESPSSESVVRYLVPLVSTHELQTGRKQKRGPARMRDLEHAVAAIVGAVLIAWAGTEPRAVFRSLMKAGFTGARVKISDFKPAVEAMVACGFLSWKSGIAYAGPFHEVGDQLHRMASRWWPTQTLLDLATEHRLTPDNIQAAFQSNYSETAPALPPDVLQMSHTTYSRKANGKLETKEIAIPIPPDDRAGQARRRAVERDNEEAAKHDVRGCLPPRWIERHVSWKPQFVSDWRLHGRRYSLGADGSYQTLPEAERERITIDGEPVVELDVKASHLTIVHGLLKLPLPKDDLYHVEGLDRSVVKAWILQTLGSGRVRARWSLRTPLEVRAVSHKLAARLILKRYPFLADLIALIPERYREHPEPWRLLPHVLMALEAAALAIASQFVKVEMPGTLALPMHDALIVPFSAEMSARRGLVQGYQTAAGVTPRVAPDRNVRGWREN